MISLRTHKEEADSEWQNALDDAAPTNLAKRKVCKNCDIEAEEKKFFLGKW